MNKDIDPRFYEYVKLFDYQDCHESNKNYAIRVNQSAKEFERLKPVEQEFIKGAKEDGFRWRGEPMFLFKQFYEEFMKMKSMSQEERMAYRKQFSCYE